ncbi:tetratricopeptide repeat protein [Streptomyces sp. NPDC056503]|uniref:tetratricopeptide repeat protein n=1 Tax=Streptomyces sp. NPDC056503 TaxID=3345842 RepID=UPI00369DA73F
MSEQHSQVSGNARNYQAGHSIHITETAAAAPQAVDSLPAAPELTGREEPTAALLKALGPDGSGVTVVTGLPGVGKTALAVHAAHQAVSLGRFPGGTLFVHLRGYDPAGAVAPQQALEALLRALGVRDDDLPPTPEEQAGLYRSLLARRAAEHGPMLILADDASSSSQLLPLVPAHSAHRLLSTSRDTLTAPDLRPRLIPLDELTPDAAAELVTSALTQPRPDDPRPEAEPAALAELVAHCGRLPLALTIAAALLTDDPGLPIAALAEDLADTRTRLQTLRHEDAAGRSLAVRAAFDLSYGRLTEPDARLFRLLPVNPGPDLSTETAAVLNSSPVRATRTALAALARACLITEQPVGSGRWRMHDLIRLYASELPAGEDDAGALERLMVHYYVTCDAADDHLRALPGQPVPDLFAGRADALEWLDAERANLIATVPLAAMTVPPVALHLTAALGVYLHLRRHFHDALALGEHALAAARELEDRRGEAQALSNLGNDLQELRRFDEAAAANSQAVTIYGELDDRHSEAQALNNLGNALQELRRFDEAIAIHTQAATTYRELDDLHSAAQALSNLGLGLQAVRRFDQAITVHTEAIDIFEEVGDRHGKAQALNNLGLVLRAVHRYEEAVRTHSEDLALCVELNDRHGEAQALNNLSLALQAALRHDEAIDAHTRAIDIFRELADRHGEAQALNNFGITLQELDRHDEAIGAHARAAATYRELDDRHSEGTALNNLGLALRALRRYDEAVAALDQALVIFRETGDSHGEQLTAQNLAECLNTGEASARRRRWWPFGRRRAGRVEA